jgi:hypothetical protein
MKEFTRKLIVLMAKGMSLDPHVDFNQLTKFQVIMLLPPK